MALKKITEKVGLSQTFGFTTTTSCDRAKLCKVFLDGGIIDNKTLSGTQE